MTKSKSKTIYGSLDDILLEIDMSMVSLGDAIHDGEKYRSKELDKWKSKYAFWKKAKQILILAKTDIIKAQKEFKV